MPFVCSSFAGRVDPGQVCEAAEKKEGMYHTPPFPSLEHQKREHSESNIRQRKLVSRGNEVLEPVSRRQCANMYQGGLIFVTSIQQYQYLQTYTCKGIHSPDQAISPRSTSERKVLMCHAASLKRSNAWALVHCHTPGLGKCCCTTKP